MASLTSVLFEQNKLRRGKWSNAEMAYAEGIIREYRAGSLDDVEGGMSLRGYLAQKLQCHVKRISKKFENTTYNGKRQYKKNSMGLSEGEVETRRAKLESLRKGFMDSVIRAVPTVRTRNGRAPLNGDIAHAPPSIRTGNMHSQSDQQLRLPPSGVVDRAFANTAGETILPPSRMLTSPLVIANRGTSPQVSPSMPSHQAALLGLSRLPLPSSAFASATLGTTRLPVSFNSGRQDASYMKTRLLQVAMENRRLLDQLSQQGIRDYVLAPPSSLTTTNHFAVPHRPVGPEHLGTWGERNLTHELLVMNQQQQQRVLTDRLHHRQRQQQLESILQHLQEQQQQQQLL